MVRSSASCSLCQNPHDGKNELAGGTPTEGSNRHPPAPVVIHALIPAVALGVAPLAASGSANSSVVRYLEDDLQRILRTVLDFRPSTPVLAHVVAAALHSEGPHEWPLKA